MSSLRMQSLANIRQNQGSTLPESVFKSSDRFGESVFNKKAMREFLSPEIYESLLEAIDLGHGITPDVARQVANGMKNWALAKGATHYTHWFQPLTGSTAEKHDSFFSLNNDGEAIEAFSGGALVQQEPDASSFPNGGIRNTFEARGYTAWDPSSPAFVLESPAGKTLCIPTIFVSYTGESLDYKSPLLKSLAAVEKAGVAVCQYFDKNITRVYPTLGVEQEYFLVDSALFDARPDLVLSGRTLFGHGAARGQQLEDHYFGTIPERVHAFMVDFENEAYRLGIPLKTRHNEVAPGQFECAPLFEEINLAVDHNQLLMDLMEKIAKRHGLSVLLHEKPFAGVNGSGKHNNWSLATNTGKNLLSPGKTPKSNLMFLTFFVNAIKAFHDHADLIRASIASAGNDHRLGANEAPPAIMSAFLGEQLSRVLDEIEKGKLDKDQVEVRSLMHHIKAIPEILLDNTDRNRTSPFAFTGNKFELRAVGSASNCAAAMTVLNSAMAQSLTAFKAEVDKAIGDGESREGAILKVLQKYIKATKKIRFEGNGYGDEWQKEAAKRGLSNFRTTPDALDAMVSKSTIQLFEKTGVYSHREIEARHEIMLENYIKKIQIESRLVGELSLTQIVPAAMAYQQRCMENLRLQKELGMNAKSSASLKVLAETIAQHISAMVEQTEKMRLARKKANEIDSTRAMAQAYCDQVKPYLESIRDHSDRLEILIDNELWPLPKYRELLFLK
ncbi:MAG: glutamine synthetase III [Bacteroidia bacterium]|jgi:glutamine synthetase|nr:glutamine synthetase III [Bacteroidia bacterium]